MALKMCENGTNQFEGDENKRYCSNACKQNAYRKRKNEVAEQILSNKFSMSEFKQVLETELGKKYFAGNQLLYCYMRKNLPQEISFEKLMLYIEHNAEEFKFITDFERVNFPPSYKVFSEKYLSGEIQMID